MRKGIPRAGARIAVSALVLLAGASASAQGTVAVNNGQTLTEDALRAGMFDGRAFTLSPDLTFDINFGGAIGPVGDVIVAGPVAPFSFTGSTVNINNGGLFASSFGFPSAVSNLNLNVFAGGSVTGIRPSR